jgi:hypothetical protein
MTSSLLESLNDAIKTPWKTFAFGSGVFAFILAIAWIISGDYLDEIWLHQLWLVPSVGLSCAGVSARLNPLSWRRWVSRFVITAFVIVGVSFIATIGLPLTKTDHPVMMFAIVAGVVTIVYHAVLGTVALVVSAGSHVFVKRHRLSS